ncbi:MAG: hypothetical protein J6Y08_10510 [Clostridiales bacterium]|nr:hypothetical protein [Clostridiales bacterium]
MYTLIKTHVYKLVHDKLFWILLGVCFLFQLWAFSPRPSYGTFVYTGPNPAFTEYVNKVGASVVTEPTLLENVIRRAITLVITAFFMSYSFVYCNREKKSHVFENICAIHSNRTEVFFSNILAQMAMVIPFFLLNSLNLVIWSLYTDPHMAIGDARILLPYLVGLVIYVSFLISLSYSLYMLTHRVLVPVVVFLSFSINSLFKSDAKGVPVLQQITQCNISRILSKLNSIRSWGDCLNLALYLLPVTIIVVVLTTTVVRHRDLD